MIARGQWVTRGDEGLLGKVIRVSRKKRQRWADIDWGMGAKRMLIVGLQVYHKQKTEERSHE
jgi:hypothetical protein